MPEKLAFQKSAILDMIREIIIWEYTCYQIYLVMSCGSICGVICVGDSYFLAINIDIEISLINLGKAYNRVPRQEVWRCIRKKEAAGKSVE